MTSEPRAFPGAAAGALVPVSDKVARTKEQALAGSLRIDLDAARAILAQLRRLRARAGELVRDCAELDTPLRFGDNWVGQIVSERLRTVAVDRDGGVTPVLEEFHRLLDALTVTVELAAGLYEANEERSADELRRTVGEFGVMIKE